jgi:hypothetical protein
VCGERSKPVRRTSKGVRRAARVPVWGGEGAVRRGRPARGRRRPQGRPGRGGGARTPAAQALPGLTRWRRPCGPRASSSPRSARIGGPSLAGSRGRWGRLPEWRGGDEFYAGGGESARVQLPALLWILCAIMDVRGESKLHSGQASLVWLLPSPQRTLGRATRRAASACMRCGTIIWDVVRRVAGSGARSGRAARFRPNSVDVTLHSRYTSEHGQYDLRLHRASATTQLAGGQRASHLFIQTSFTAPDVHARAPQPAPVPAPSRSFANRTPPPGPPLRRFTMQSMASISLLGSPAAGLSR